MLARIAILFTALFLAAAPAARAEDPDAATIALLKANGLQDLGLDIRRPQGFATIVLLSRYVPDAGPFYVGGFVGKRWINGENNQQGWALLSTAAMRAFGWPRLSEPARKALALRWVQNALPRGQDTRRPARGPGMDAMRWQEPSVTQQGDRIVVRAWITYARMTIGGPHFDYPKAPTLFFFARDGAVSIVWPG